MSQTFLEDIPEFLEIQRNSFLRILDNGLVEALEKINPISTVSGSEYGLLFYPKDYRLVLPENTITEALLQGKTYGCKIYVPALLYETEKKNIYDLKTKEVRFFQKKSRLTLTSLKGKVNLLDQKKILAKKLEKILENKNLNPHDFFYQKKKIIPGVRPKSLKPVGSGEISSRDFRFQTSRGTPPETSNFGLGKSEAYSMNSNFPKRTNPISFFEKNLLTSLTSSKSFNYLAKEKERKQLKIVSAKNVQKNFESGFLSQITQNPLYSLKFNLHSLLKNKKERKDISSKTTLGFNLTLQKKSMGSWGLSNLKPSFFVIALEEGQKFWKFSREAKTFYKKGLPGKDKIEREGVALDMVSNNSTLSANPEGLTLKEKVFLSKERGSFFSSLAFEERNSTFSKANFLKNTLSFKQKITKPKRRVKRSGDEKLLLKARGLSKKEWVCIGILPLMTPRGHFIINGSHRIIISQMSRAPGLYYQKNDKLQATIVPTKGAWLRINLKISENGETKIWVRITPQRKMPYKIFIETYKYLENFKNSGKSQSKFLTLTYKNINSKIKHFDKHYAIGVITGQINRTLLNSTGYTLGSLGRKRLNERLGTNEKRGYLTSKDLSLIKNRLIKLLEQNSTGLEDDIDHLENRRVRTCGELLQTEIEVGMVRLKKAIIKQLNECLNPNSFFAFKGASEKNLGNSNTQSSINKKKLKNTLTGGVYKPQWSQKLNLRSGEARTAVSSTNPDEPLESKDSVNWQSQRLEELGLFEEAENLSFRSIRSPWISKPFNLFDRLSFQNMERVSSLPGGGLLDPTFLTKKFILKRYRPEWSWSKRLKRGEGFTSSPNPLNILRVLGELPPLWFSRQRVVPETLWGLEANGLGFLEFGSPQKSSTYTRFLWANKGKRFQKVNPLGSLDQRGGEVQKILPPMETSLGLNLWTRGEVQSKPKPTPNFFLQKLPQKEWQIYWPQRFGIDLSSLEVKTLLTSLFGNPSLQKLYQNRNDNLLLQTGLTLTFDGRSAPNRLNFSPLLFPSYSSKVSGDIQFFRYRGFQPLANKFPWDVPKSLTFRTYRGLWRQTLKNLDQKQKGFYKTSIKNFEDNTRFQKRGIAESFSSKKKKQFLAWSPSKIVGTKPFGGALREFFGSNPLSQYMDQTNPLAEITHKRRLSSLGPGGVDRGSAGIAIRGIHPSHYGRICPIETPEGKNAGLVNSMTMWTRVNSDGFLETPYLKVKGGSITSHQNNLLPEWCFVSTKIENNGISVRPNSNFSYSRGEKQKGEVKIVASDLKISDGAFLPNILLPTRDGSERSFGRSKRKTIDFCGVSPMQNISVATSLIPFLEHDDATRALMGSNMQRQAVPLLKAQAPLIRTGLEGKVVGESGHALQAISSGVISTATRSLISIDTYFVEEKYRLPTIYTLIPPPSFFYKNTVSLNRNILDFILSPSLSPLKKGKGYGELSSNPSRKKYPELNREISLFLNKISTKKQQIWRKTPKVQRKRIAQNLQGYTRSNQATICNQRPAVTEGDWIQKGDLIGDCSASANGVLALGQNIVIAYLPMEGFNFEDAIVVSDRLVHEELYTSIHVQRVEFDIDAVIKKSFPPKIKLKKQKSAYKTNGGDWITLNNPHLLPSEKQNLNPLGIIQIGSWVGPGDVLVSKVFPVERKIAPSRHLLLAVFQEKKTKGLETDDTSLRVPKGIHGRVINVKIIGNGITRSSLTSQRVRKTSLFNQTIPVEKTTATKNAKIKVNSGSLRFHAPLRFFCLQGKYRKTVNILDSESEKRKKRSEKGEFDLKPFGEQKGQKKKSSSNSLWFQEERGQTQKAVFPEASIILSSKEEALEGEVGERASLALNLRERSSPLEGEKLQNTPLEGLRPRGQSALTQMDLRAFKPQGFTEPLALAKSVEPAPSEIAASAKKPMIQKVRKPLTSWSQKLWSERESGQKAKASDKVRPGSLWLRGYATSSKSSNLQTSEKSKVFRGTQPPFGNLGLEISLYEHFAPSPSQNTLDFWNQISQQKKSLEEGKVIENFTIFGYKNRLKKPFKKRIGLNRLSYLNLAFRVVNKNALEAINHKTWAKAWVRARTFPLCFNGRVTEFWSESLDGEVSQKIEERGSLDHKVGAWTFGNPKPNLGHSKLFRVKGGEFKEIKGDGNIESFYKNSQAIEPEGLFLEDRAHSMTSKSPKPLALNVSQPFFFKEKNSKKKDFETIFQQDYRILQVRVYIAERKKLQVGDKMSGRHGNKGIVSTILPREDMPYLPDGTSVDMVLNPLGIPSRMNVGQVFECLLGLATSFCGETVSHTPFDEMYGPEASRSLVYLFLYVARLRTRADWLFQPNFPGKTVLFDGRTGEPFEQWVTVGRAYMLKLIHMVDEKIHARSIGPRLLVTQQPVKGRGRGGGQRLGEMELWAFEGFGAAYTLQEILTLKSDDIKGRENVENSIISAKTAVPHIPETFRMMLFELRCLCLNVELNQNS